MGLATASGSRRAVLTIAILTAGCGAFLGIGTLPDDGPNSDPDPTSDGSNNGDRIVEADGGSSGSSGSSGDHADGAASDGFAPVDTGKQTDIDCGLLHESCGAQTPCCTDALGLKCVAQVCESCSPAEKACTSAGECCSNMCMPSSTSTSKRCCLPGGSPCKVGSGGACCSESCTPTNGGNGKCFNQ